MNVPTLDIEAEQQELVTIALESLGWTPLEHGAYLHVQDPRATEA